MKTKLPQIIIEAVTNGYIIQAFDEASNLVDTRVATSLANYSNDGLSAQIESIYEDYKVAQVKAIIMATATADDDSDIPF